MDTLDKLRLLRLESWELKKLIWQQSFLTPSWWFIGITIIIAYAVWWKFTDKKRIIELLLFGSFIAVTRVIFDDWGITSGRWTYTIDLVPLGISLFLNDLTIVPLGHMLAYQYSPTWSRYLILVTLTQGIISFAFLPLLAAIGILNIYNWKYSDTFLFMLITTIIMRAIILFGLRLQQNSRLEDSGDIPAGLIHQPAMKPLDRRNDSSDKD